MSNSYVTTGVIVGRFQVSELHSAHLELIDRVCAKHANVIVFLGVSPVLNSNRNPLNFQTRKVMISQEYPNLTILPLPDNKFDAEWSANLDARIDEIAQIGEVVLYGGRDSFLSHYLGRFKTKEIQLQKYTKHSGTQSRRNDASQVLKNKSFRKGVIYATHNKYPTAYPTVDVAVYHEEKNRVLMGRKGPNDSLCFPGGFVSPGETLETAALRELREETGGNLEVADLKYVGSAVIDDWRYAKETDKIITSFFTVKYLYGFHRATDDLYSTEWMTLSDDEVTVGKVAGPHRELWLKLCQFHGKKSNI